MTLQGEDSDGNKLNAELEELEELRTEKKILSFLEPMKEVLDAIKKDVAELRTEVTAISTKVVIHNNYESRIRTLERNQYVFGAISLVIGFFTGAGGALIYKLLTRI